MIDAVSCYTGVELAAATGGRWIAAGDVAAITGICTDTRDRADGHMFVALEGERFDGHDFLAEAVRAGCSALCIRASRHSDCDLPPGIPLLLVEDTLQAYQQIACFHRARCRDLELIAVTGSVGKTSVKEMLRAILSAAAEPDRVLATADNTNNQVGVPRNLLQLTGRHRYAVIEMGTNHFGEIEPLSRCARPNVAVINSIAPCHLEFLGDLDGVAREKSHIFDGLTAGGVAILPQDTPGAAILKEAAGKFRTLSFGEDPQADVRCQYLHGALEGSTFRLTFPDGAECEVEWALAGRHQTENAAAAAAAAWSLGIPAETIASGLRQTRLPGMRGKITRRNGVTYVNDAYNANPASMRAAFHLLAEFVDPARLTLVLGEMRELGEAAAASHLEIYRLALDLFPGAKIVTVGEEFCRAGGALHFNSAEEAAGVVSAARAGEIVFAKGSRGIQAEKALPPEAR